MYPELSNCINDKEAIIYHEVGLWYVIVWYAEEDIGRTKRGFGWLRYEPSIQLQFTISNLLQTYQKKKKEKSVIQATLLTKLSLNDAISTSSPVVSRISTTESLTRFTAWWRLPEPLIALVIPLVTLVKFISLITAKSVKQASPKDCQMHH